MTTQEGFAKCYFCRRIFKNKQAVKVHLKGCIAYREHVPRQGLPKGMPEARNTVIKDFREQSEPERMRLTPSGITHREKHHMTRNYTGLVKIPGEAQDQ